MSHTILLKWKVLYIFQDNPDHTREFERQVLAKFREPTVWGLVKGAFHERGMPAPRDVRLGCIELLLEEMSPDQAKALLEAVHSGKLKEMLSKVSRYLDHVHLSAQALCTFTSYTMDV